MAVTRFKNAGWNLVAGLVMLFLGAVIWLNPFGTMLALAFYIGIGFILAGGFYLLASMSIRSGWYLLVGVFDFIVGLILVGHLGVTAASLPVILALWSLTIGIIQIIGAFEIRRNGWPWAWSMMMGMVGVIFGLIILAYPMVGAITISTVVGLYAIVFGILQLAEYYMSRNSWALVITDKKRGEYGR